MTVKKEKNRRPTASISRVIGRAPFAPINREICLRGYVADLISHLCHFSKNRSQGFGSIQDPKNGVFVFHCNIHQMFYKVVCVRILGEVK